VAPKLSANNESGITKVLGILGNYAIHGKIIFSAKWISVSKFDIAKYAPRNVFMTPPCFQPQQF
jgi:hypothetical protein